jgi:two-component system sensor histidine kinase KdpD
MLLSSPLWLAGRARAWLGMFLLLESVTAIGIALDGAILLTSQAMLYLLAVVVAAHHLDRKASMACAVAAVVSFNFFFVPPRYTLGVTNQGFAVALVTMLAVALLVSQLAARARAQTRQALASASRAAALQGLSVQLAQAESDAQVVQAARAALTSALNGTPCQVALRIADALSPAPRWSDGTQPLEPLPRALGEAFECCARERAALGPGTPRWPDLADWYVPLIGGGTVLGVACVPPPAAQGPAERAALLAHVQSLCALAGQAVWRIRWATSARQAQAESAQHALRSTLLAAVSHDLRTPLAVIVGAASALTLQGDRLPEAERRRMLSSIRTEADHLAEVTANTLQWMRLSGDGVRIQRDWESLEEVVGAVLGRVRQREGGRRITAQVPSGLPLVRADPVLLAQLLANLLDNALLHGQGAIDLRVAVTGGGLALEVKDRGPGVDPEVMAQWGQPFVRGAAARAHRGSGLGLAVCDAIVRAHGGEFGVRRRRGGGSCFTALFPIDMPQPLGAP